MKRFAMRALVTSHIVLNGFVCGAALGLAGCAGSSGGDSSYGPISGTLTAVEPAEFETTRKATMAAMNDLRLRPMERDRDGFRSFIVGESIFGSLSQSHEVRVWVERKAEDKTKIEMRILGRRDRDRLEQLLAAIQNRLGTAKPTAAAKAAPAAQPAPETKAAPEAQPAPAASRTITNDSK
jgi:hypothetical protein